MDDDNDSLFPLHVRTDNSASIKISSTYNYQGRCKHVDTKYFVLREKVLKGERKMLKVDGVKNLADTLTKPVTHKTFENLAPSLVCDVKKAMNPK